MIGVRPAICDSQSEITSPLKSYQRIANRRPDPNNNDDFFFFERSGALGTHGPRQITGADAAGLNDSGMKAA